MPSEPRVVGIVLVTKANKDYPIGIEVVIEMDCLLILEMILGCATPYAITNLRRKCYQKYGGESNVMLEDEDVAHDCFKIAPCICGGSKCTNVQCLQ